MKTCWDCEHHCHWDEYDCDCRKNNSDHYDYCLEACTPEEVLDAQENCDDFEDINETQNRRDIMRPKDSVWKIEHSRKGELTIKLLRDVTDDEWIYCEIVEGHPKMLSIAGNLEPPGPGSQETYRNSLITWIEKLE